MEINCPECGSAPCSAHEWTCGSHTFGDRLHISQACDYLSQLHEAKDEISALTAEVERLKEELHALHRRKCAYCNPAEMRRIFGDPCGVTIMNNDPEKAMEFLAGKLLKLKDRPDA